MSAYILGAQDVTRVRRTAAAMVGGRPGTPTEAETTISAAVQPAGRRAQFLPPAIRDTVAYVVFSYSELRAHDRLAGTLADRIEFGGETLEVVYVYPRVGQSAMLSHYEAFVTRVSEGG